MYLVVFFTFAFKSQFASQFDFTFCLFLAGCATSVSTMTVFGQPVAAHLTVSSSPVTVFAGRQFHAGSQSHPIPFTDVRCVTMVKHDI